MAKINITRFCIECGKKTDKLINGLCIECYLKANKPLAKIDSTYSIRICPQCYSYRSRGRWVKTGSLIEAISNYMEENIRHELSKKGVKVEDFKLEKIQRMRKGRIRCLIRVVARIHPKLNPVEDRREIIVVPKWTLCENCLKAKSGYYEAIIQIRAENRRISEEERMLIENKIEEIVSKGIVRPEAITEIEELNEGINLKLTSYREALKISKLLSKEFLASIKETYSTIGFRGGRERRKITILVKLPSFKVGDIVKYKGGTYKIMNIYHEKIYAYNLEDHKMIVLSQSERNRIKPVSYTRRYGMIISAKENLVQVMLMDNYQIIELDLRRRPDWLKEGMNVEVFKVKDKLYIARGL